MIKIPVGLTYKARSRHDRLGAVIAFGGKGDDFRQASSFESIANDSQGRFDCVTLTPGGEGEAPGDFCRPGHRRGIIGPIEGMQARHAHKRVIGLVREGQEPVAEMLPFIGPGAQTRRALRPGANPAQPVGDPWVGHHRGEGIKIIIAERAKNQSRRLDHAGRADVSAP